MLIRNAFNSDAADLARLINMAGEGLPEYLWREEAQRAGITPRELGARRAAREEGSFSYRNARIAEIEGNVCGMSLAYRLDDTGSPSDLESLPREVHPLIELEVLAPGSWYLNAVAACPDWRGQGIGKALMEDCEEAAVFHDAPAISLIVSSENKGAHRLYLRLGYREQASLPLVTWPGGPGGGNWILMVKGLPA